MLARQMLNMVNPNDPQEKWWDPIVSSASEMTYICDATLGSPAAVDCEKLLYQGFGAGNQIVSLRPGSPKFFTEGTCSLAVSTTVPLKIVWDQITAAFESLLDLCVESPPIKSRGGRASFGFLSDAMILNDLLIMDFPTGGKKARDLVHRVVFDNTTVGNITGLNALPPGANLTIWKNGGNLANLRCEFAAASQGKPVSLCSEI